MYYKGFKIRIYPTKEQENLIWKHFGATRWIWNYMLNIQLERYKNKEKYLSNYDMIALIPFLRKQEEYKWINEISCKTLQLTLNTLHMTYTNYFKKTSCFPKFKSKKKSKLTFPVTSDKIAFYFKDKDKVKVPKIGFIKYKSDFTFNRNQKFSNVYISYINGKYILSFSLICENQTEVNLTSSKMGIDLGVKELATVAIDNDVFIFHNINKSKTIKNIENKISKLQKSLSRKYRFSKTITGQYKKTCNIIKTEEKLRKLYARLNGIRNNYIHQITHMLVKKIPSEVIMEKLKVSHLLKQNAKMNKLIQDAKFRMFIDTMKYKCENIGIKFIQVSEYYPSSKICSNCGNIKKNLKLSDRIYRCDECGFTIDRDYNAALNLMRYEA